MTNPLGASLTAPSSNKPMNETIGTTSAILGRFIKDGGGQDLIEYTLLLAFVALSSAALFFTAGGSVNTIWSVANIELSAGAASATS